LAVAFTSKVGAEALKITQELKKMQFIDLVFQQQRIRDKLDANINAVFNHGQYIMGPEVRELEERLGAYAGAQHAVACSSGTDALLLALMAYDVGPGDAIFTTPFTFISTAEVISLIGATPVFVDIDPVTYNISPKDLERAVSAVRTNDPAMYPLPVRGASSKEAHPPLIPKGVIAVDLYGLPADYDQINAIARQHGMFVIEDAAQSFGGESRGGGRAGALADIGCTSFFPAKPLGCYGDGGMCFTDDGVLAEVMRSISLHGKGSDKYENIRVGINGRLDTLQAAILLAKFEIFPEEIELRQSVAQSYTGLLSASSFTTPRIPDGYRSAWAQYSLMVEEEEQRSEVQNRLKEAGVPTAVYYPKPLHLQTAFQKLGYKTGDFPASEDCARRIFSLPMHPYLKNEEIAFIAQHLISIIK
jgi:UDP-2-acetamido-2-deoxy-ribo-hexuluronate aminotransferase